MAGDCGGETYSLQSPAMTSSSVLSSTYSANGDPNWSISNTDSISVTGGASGTWYIPSGLPVTAPTITVTPIIPQLVELRMAELEKKIAELEKKLSELLPAALVLRGDPEEDGKRVIEL